MIDSQKLEALSFAKGMDATPANLERVAKVVGAESARWAFGQWELRARARAKFSRADEMLFTREALEQATHESVATYHASLFESIEGTRADLTTGIGADLIALAPATGYELDPERAEYARHNLAVYGKSAEVITGDSMAADFTFDAVFADPARRVAGRRTHDISAFSPDPRELARRMLELEFGCIKLTPILADPTLEALGSRLEFISFGRECREALVLTGKQAGKGRAAVHVESGQKLEVFATPARAQQIAPQDFLYEADPAAIRAHALEILSDRYGLSALGDSNGYLTGSQEVDSVWLKRYPVLYSGKADLSTTKQELRRLEAAKPILKQRGANLDLQKLAKEFKPQGSRAVALVIWPVGKSLRHTIVQL
jgi:hypothetical protein